MALFDAAVYLNPHQISGSLVIAGAGSDMGLLVDPRGAQH